ncbi:hypothetical protein RhiirC2_800922 [Rhizophagus irregularis]|uniref:Uncharacterized protein n=1 Tax=Rhizophagus irregularis TaxID=588596 RepID=A0A2N1M376_9GLOM|nr:hypothetical protein RhiirC2_800922 [Rhizophagus irregularis]
MGKERVCARNTTRNKSSRSTSSKTITSEADRIAAHLAAARTSSAQQKRREASVEIVIPVIPLVPLPIITNSRRICETSIVQDRETSIIQDQEFALNYSIVRDTFDNDASPLNVNISRSMEKVPTADTSAFYLQIVDDSYWKNLASKTCKVQLPLLGLYPDDLKFKKEFEAILEREKPRYIEQLGEQ